MSFMYHFNLKVVFHDVADSYPNDTDIIISFTLTTNVPVVKETPSQLASSITYSKKIAGDRIGIFKVPYVSPSDILKFEWVTETDCTNEGGVQDVGTVVFKGTFGFILFHKKPFLKGKQATTKKCKFT